MLKFVGAILICGGLLPATAARAQDCANAADQATLNQCADIEFKTADEALNKAYKEIEARLDGEDDRAGLLVSAQRAWIAFRDAECGFQSSGVEGGSVQPMIRMTCLASVTSQRVKELESYLDCEEGDMSCPVPPAR